MTINNYNSIAMIFGKKEVNYFNEEVYSFNDMYNIELEKQYYISRAFIYELLETLYNENECIIICFYGSLLDCYLLYNSEHNKAILIREKYVSCCKSKNTVEVTSDINKVKSFIKDLYNCTADAQSKNDLISLYNNLNYDTFFKNSTVARL